MTAILTSGAIVSGTRVGPSLPTESPITIASTGSTPASGLSGVFSNIGHGLDGFLNQDTSDGSTAIPGDAHVANPPVDAGSNMTSFVLFVVVAIGIFWWVNR